MILIVEDSDSDFRALNRAFVKSGVNNPIHRCSTAEQASEFMLKNADTNATDEQPCLVMLDLNLPGMGGIEFLQLLKNDEKLKTLPVLIFTSSSSPDDIIECYKQGANSYFVKPLDIEKLYHIVDRIGEYWFQLSKTPTTYQ